MFIPRPFLKGGAAVVLPAPSRASRSFLPAQGQDDSHGALGHQQQPLPRTSHPAVHTLPCTDRYPLTSASVPRLTPRAPEPPSGEVLTPRSPAASILPSPHVHSLHARVSLQAVLCPHPHYQVTHPPSPIPTLEPLPAPVRASLTAQVPSFRVSVGGPQPLPGGPLTQRGRISSALQLLQPEFKVEAPLLDSS